jgi:hypothetical protein
VQPEGHIVTRDDDLAGFWDMVFLQIEDCKRKFAELSQIRSNNWSRPTSARINLNSKTPQSTPAKPKIATTTENGIAKPNGASSSSAIKTPATNAAAKARADAARQRLLEAKSKAAAAASAINSNSLSTASHPDIQIFQKT